MSSFTLNVIGYSHEYYRRAKHCFLERSLLGFLNNLRGSFQSNSCLFNRAFTLVRLLSFAMVMVVVAVGV